MSMSTSGADADGGQQRETIVLRPRAVRVATYFSAVVVMAGMIGGAVLITSFQWGGRLGLILVGVLVFLFCHPEASVKGTARPASLEVGNLTRTRTLAWPERLGVTFPVRVTRAEPASRHSGRPGPRTGTGRGPRRGSGPSWSSARASPRGRRADLSRPPR